MDLRRAAKKVFERKPEDRRKVKWSLLRRWKTQRMLYGT
jgi:hypothetical protein